MTRAPVKPELVRWARERSGIARDDLARTFPRLPEWESGNTQPTLKQAKDFARRVHVPVGYMFLSRPPEETIPIPDFRTPDGRWIERPSPELLDTIYTCQRRQDWYRDYARAERLPELDFVGSATIQARSETTAEKMREILGFDPKSCASWSDALRLFIQKAEAAGILVMVNGIVGSNTRRPLDPAEFRGFALADPIAPLIFINGADTKAAQIFTLAHEMAHLWLGESALSDTWPGLKPNSRSNPKEVWCNAVAAEFLVPMDALKRDLRENEPPRDAMSRLARAFKVSTLVILRRLLDARWIDRNSFEGEWARETERLTHLEKRSRSESGGGDFYNTTLVRAGRRFTQALVTNTLEGQTPYRDAFRMLGISKTDHLNKLAQKAGMAE